MSTNNDVTQVMVLPSDTAAVTANHVSQLANGAWGVFNYETGVAFDPGTSAAFPEKYFFAHRGDGTLGVAGKLYKSAGEYIGKSSLVAYTKDAPVAALAQQILLSAIDAEANNEYSVRLEFRGNSEVYTRFGSNAANKYYIADLNCPLTGGAAGEVAAQIAEQLDDDDDSAEAIIETTGAIEAGTYVVVVAGGASADFSNLGGPAAGALAVGTQMTLTAGTPTVYDSAVVAKLDDTAFITYTMTDDAGATWGATKAEVRAVLTASDTDVQLKIFVHTLSSTYAFCNINPKYFKQRQVTAIPSISSAACVWATFAETVAMGYEEGTGYDILELEYEAGGFNGDPGPYRQSGLHGLPIQTEKNTFDYLATATATYDMFALQYEPEYVAGWLRHKQSKSTYFATVESGDGSSDGKLQDVLDNAAIAGGLVPDTDI